MVIDSHQHFWHYDPARHAWITDEMSALRRDFLPGHYESECAANGVDASVVVQVDQTESETGFLLELAELFPRIAGVVGWVDLRSPHVEGRLRHFSQFKKLCGFRHIAQAEADDRFLVQPAFLDGIARLHAFNFTYDILVYPKQLPAAIELASRFPQQRFVLDHLAKPFIKAGTLEPWASHMKTLAQNPNVFCKLSGLVTEADWGNWKPDDFQAYLDVVFAAFGADRLMFGSDWPVCRLAASYAQVRQLIEGYVDAHAPQHKQKMFCDNAIRFYGLEAACHGLAA